MTEQGALLTSALLAVGEALRMNPDRYDVIYNSGYDNMSDNSNAAAAAISFKTYQNYYYSEYHEGLIEVAKVLLSNLLNQIKTLVAAVLG